MIAVFLLPSIAQAGAQVIEWYGYDDCIELRNEECQVILTPSFGGKIMRYRLHGKDSLVIDPEEAGFVYDPVKDNKTFDGGGRFDFGPTQQFPNRRLYTIGKWEGEIIGDRHVRLISQVDPMSGLQLIREFELDEIGAGLRVTQTMRNLGSAPVSAFYWARTFALGHGIVVVPKTEPLWYANGYARKEDGLLNTNPKGDSAVRQMTDCTVIFDEPEYPKMGFDSTAGWCAYAMTNDLLMIRTFPVYPSRMYADIVGGFLSIYYNRNYLGKSVVEIEPIGPLETIDSGENSSFAERWNLHEFPFPGKREGIDLERIESLVDRIKML